jgi:hypothetical protein
MKHAVKTSSGAQVRELAIAAGARWPELVEAQWALESGRGAKLAAKNNPFGLKGKGGQYSETTEFVSGKERRIVDSFLEFDSIKDAVEYLVRLWYKDYMGHTGVNTAKSAKDAARMLQSEGYATDPRYAEKLIKIMSSLPSRATLENAFEYFEGRPHQVKAIKELDASLTPAQYQAFTRAWRNDPPPEPAKKFPLPVPYFYQLDSKTWQGQRMCQSSAIAMRVKRIAPNLITDDDDYLKIVNRFGDTVSQEAHAKALAHLGLKAEFRTDGTEALLLKLLDEGCDVPVGVLHRGPVSSPSGGGHWLDLIGYDDKYFDVHDPFGEMDLVRGGYVSNSPGAGKNQKYTRANLLKRWLIASKSDGWLWIIRK